MDNVYSKGERLAELTKMTGVGGSLAACELRAYKSATVPNPATVLADLTECDFDDYAAITVTWGTPYVRDDGVPCVPAILAEFAATTEQATPNGVTGIGLVAGIGGTPILAATRWFSSVRTIAHAGDGFTEIFEYELPTT